MAVRAPRGVGGFLAQRAQTGSTLARTLRQKSQTCCIAVESDKPCFLRIRTNGKRPIGTNLQSAVDPALEEKWEYLFDEIM